MNDAFAGGGIGLLIGMLFVIIGIVFIFEKTNASTWRTSIGVLVLILGCIGVGVGTYELTIGSFECADDNLHNSIQIIEVNDLIEFTATPATPPLYKLPQQCTDTDLGTTLTCIQDANIFKLLQNDKIPILPALDDAAEVILLTPRCVLYRSATTQEWHRLTRAAEHIHIFTEDIKQFASAETCFMLLDNTTLLQLSWDAITGKITDARDDRPVTTSSTRPKIYNDATVLQLTDTTEKTKTWLSARVAFGFANASNSPADSR
jgi:hypothetical protein